jgi:hypothetical protein
MAADIKLDEHKAVVEAFSLEIKGADLLIDLAERRGGAGGAQRRALVHGPGDVLTVNWARDYSGGVQVHGKVSAPDGLSVPIKGLGLEMANVGDELYKLRSEMMALREQLEDLQIRSTITAEARHYTQGGWSSCDRCAHLTFAPNQARGVCPADKRQHGVDKGARYTLFVNKSRYAAQAGWGWCHKCQGMTHGTEPLSGHCPAGGTHDRSRSPSYLLWAPEVVQSGADAKDFKSQEGWRKCSRCQGLFLGAMTSVCPAPGGGAHNGAGSWNYHLQW